MRRGRNNESQSPKRERRSQHEPPQDERMDKLDKVVKQKNARRKELCIYYFPRALCCSIFLLFIYALSYRLTDQVILPSSHDRAHHMPRPHLPIGSTSQRSSHETSTSMLLHRRTSDHSVVDSGVGGVDGLAACGLAARVCVSDASRRDALL